MIVLDASAAVELILSTPRGQEVATRVASPAESLHAPHLLDLEVAQVLRRYELSRQVAAAECGQALFDFSSLDLTRYAHDPLCSRIWELRRNLTAYDACYVALAEALEAPLLTCDAKLARISGHRATIELIR